MYFDILKEGSTNNHNFVKKSVNWTIRQIGKINSDNNRKSLDLSYEILERNNKTINWVVCEAIRELESEKVQSKFK